MESRRVLLAVALVALLATSASAATCKKYTGTQPGARCTPGANSESCCQGPLWCDVGRCSARQVSDDEKLKACKVFSPQAGDRCDINNGLCCATGMKCDVGRCSGKPTGK